jgi:hypothetical protein
MRWGFRPGRGAPVRRGSSRSPTSYQVPPRLPAGSVAAGCPARWPSGLLTAGTPAASQAPRSRRLVAGRQGESESCRIEDLDLVEAVQEGGAGSADELGEPLNRQKVTPSVVSIFVTSHSSSRTMTSEPGAIAVRSTSHACSQFFLPFVRAEQGIPDSSSSEIFAARLC